MSGLTVIFSMVVFFLVIVYLKGKSFSLIDAVTVAAFIAFLVWYILFQQPLVVD